MFDFEAQMDLFYLVAALAFFLIAGLAPVLNRRTNRLLPWTWLGLFAFCRGAYELLGLPMVNQLGAFDPLRLTLLFLSLISLVEFGRASCPTHEGPIPRWCVYTTIGAILLFGKLTGLADLYSLQVVLSLGAGLWAAWSIFKASPKFAKSQELLTAAGVLMVLFTVAACFADNSGFFMVIMGIPIQSVRALLAIGLAACFFRASQIAVDRVMDSRSQKIYRFLISGTAIGLALIAAVGLVGTLGINYLGTKATHESLEKNDRTANRIKEIINNEMEKADRLVQLMAGSAQVQNALANSGDPAALNQANVLLDRFSHTEEGYGVCYLMNLSGACIAASNRNQPDSAVGTSYAARPYFKQAVLGLQGRFIAMGLILKDLGYYTSAPVRSDRGVIVGVVAIKRLIRSVGELKNNYDPESATFLVDPHGIVVLSNQSTSVLHSLWPLEDAVVRLVVESKQFGPGPFPPILQQQPVAGKEYLLAGKRTKVLSQPVLMEGWTLYHFGSIHQIPFYRLVGVGAMLTLGLALIGFYVSWDLTSYKAANLAAVDAPPGGDYLTPRQVKEELRQGEQKYQMLVGNINLLGEMGDLLQGCKSTVDAIPVISRYMQRLFPDLSGGIYLSSGLPDKFEVAGVWGEEPPEERLFASDDCWAVRRGRQYLVEDPGTSLLCHHLPEELPNSYQCWPIVAQGETLGVLHLRQIAHPGAGNNSEQQKEISQQLLATVVEQIALTLTNLNLQEASRKSS